MKSDIEVKDDVYNFLKDTDLVKEVSGVLSKRKRPKNSDKEDIVISVIGRSQFLSNQSFYVNVNIYVADDKVNNQAEEQSGRLRTLCKLALSTMESYVGKDYYLYLEEQGVYDVNGKDEHFINNKLLYKTNNE